MQSEDKRLKADQKTLKADTNEGKMAAESKDAEKVYKDQQNVKGQEKVISSDKANLKADQIKVNWSGRRGDLENPLRRGSRLYAVGNAQWLKTRTVMAWRHQGSASIRSLCPHQPGGGVSQRLWATGAVLPAGVIASIPRHL